MRHSCANEKERFIPAMKVLIKVLEFIVIIPIKLYQWLISPLMGKTCRFEPTCSWYMLLAIKEWGPIKGVWLGLKRISRCHPWGGHGDDPVPLRRQREGEKVR